MSGREFRLCAKNYFGCTSIETDWHKNAHCSGFSQSREGKTQYSVYPDFMGHKDLGAKTILFLIDGIYSNKSLNGIPNTKWSLVPFNNNWPNSLFASQDGVAIDPLFSTLHLRPGPMHLRCFIAITRWKKWPWPIIRLREQFTTRNGLEQDCQPWHYRTLEQSNGQKIQP